jgi:hypothetical protein
LKESASGADVSFDLANAESVTIREVPSGTKLTFRETPCAGYTVESVDAKQISDPDGIPLENRIDLAGEDGKQYEVRGNIELTYTNKKGLVPVVLRKVGYTNTDPQEQTHPLAGACFKIHEGSISGDCVTAEVGGEEVSEFTSAGADAVFFSGELKMGVRYYLEETEVPSGYNAPAGNYYFIITEDGITLNCDVPTGQSSYDSWIERQTEGGVTVYTISIRNVAGVSLPSTGGPGRGVFYLPGILLTGLAGAGAVMKKKKTE